MVFHWFNDLTQLTLGLDRDSALVITYSMKKIRQSKH
jgi:phosphoenolpyruvate synthase/pyruvate phosphate dikinase